MQTKKSITKLRDRINELTEALDNSKKMGLEEEDGLKVIKVYVSGITDTLLWVLANKDEDAEFFMRNYVLEADIKAVLEQ